MDLYERRDEGTPSGPPTLPTPAVTVAVKSRDPVRRPPVVVPTVDTPTTAPGQRERSRYETYAKPVLDRVLAAALCLLLAPLLLAIALVVRTAIGSPVFIRQPRIGRGGRSFNMLKFRTMQTCRRRGGDRRGPHRRGVGDRRQNHKDPNDPRHLPAGRWLRRWSFDELPQLLNVLRGEMSMVGPRPELAEVVARRYEPWQHARHAVKPGITGLWQVSDRRTEDAWMHLDVDIDLQYVGNVTFGTDLRLLFRTVPAAIGYPIKVSG